MFKFYFLLLSLLSLTLTSEAIVVPDQSNLTIVTPSLAERVTRKLRLENGIEVLLVSDPESPYAAAALSVGTGSSHDPQSRAGLAHYTEHMLFLGNEKYPEEEGFSRFLDTHGGKRNAFTMADRTVYMFSIANEGFDEGLDRFAHFFITPNFTSSGLHRECKAIHQEYCKNLPDDEWRMLYVKKSLCNENHSFHSFCIGNLETLSDVSHEEIKEWYDANYSANLMRLCVYSNRPLDELEKMVAPLFEKIENKELTRNETKLPLFAETKEKRCYFVAPVQERCNLELSWELPASFAVDSERHTDQLVGYVLGHEGEGSLLSQLKQEGLAYKLSCGKQKIGQGEALFILSIELTDKGAVQYEKVLASTFAALQEIKQQGIPHYIFEEVQKIGEINYCMQTRGDLFQYVMEQAMRMQDESIESYPRKSLIPTVFDKEACDQMLALLAPDRAHYMILASPKLTHISPTKKEKWMQVAYGEKKWKEGSLRQWQKAPKQEGKLIPDPNPFLPKNLELSNVPFNKGAQFELIAHEKSDQGELFVAKDHCFLTPKASWEFHYKTPIINPLSRKSGALMDLFVTSFLEAINEKYYAAKLAQIDIQMTPKEDGFILKVSGFEEKMALLITSLCKEMKELTISKNEFATYKEMLFKSYECQHLQSPLTEAGEITSSILYECYQSLSHKAEELASLTLDDFHQFCNSLFAEGYLEASCYGSQESEWAKGIWKEAEEILSYAPFNEENHLKRKLARFTKIGHPTYLESKFPMAAGGLMITMDFGDFSFESRAVQEIFSKAVEEPFFSELRTRQQTAYLVSNWSQELERHLYNFFAIQSSSHDPRDLLARFELFLESFLMNLKEHHLPEARFELIKQSLVKQLTHPQFDLPMMGHLFHTLAFEYKGDFEWLKKRTEAIEALTYSHFLESVGKMMRENRQERIAVLVKGTFEQEAPFTYELSQSVNTLKERLDYK